MKTLFSSIYTRTLRLAGHQHAQWYLGGVSFIEAIFFLVPVDVLLLPMAMSKPEKAWRYATIATTFSVLGGIGGYLLGYLFSEHIPILFDWLGLEQAQQQAVELFKRWGIWIVFLAGFTPIPYKVFTITAGLFSMAFIPFMIASLIGRASRYFLISGLIKTFGKRIEPFILRYMDAIGWGMLIIAVIVGVIYRITN